MEELKIQLSEIEDVIASFEAQIEIYQEHKFEVLKKIYPSYKSYIEGLMKVAYYYIFLEVYVEKFGIKTKKCLHFFIMTIFKNSNNDWIVLSSPCLPCNAI